MRAAWIFIICTALIMSAGYIVGPMIHPYMGEIKYMLVELKQFCHAHPVLGYVVYGILLALTILLGLPFATAIMLLAGITYNFWEATLVVTATRIAVALVAFLIVRHMIHTERQFKRRRQTPGLIQKFEHHPNLGLLLARLAPLPDTTVNYAMGASSIHFLPYVTISLIGMIPITLFFVWIGNELGSITQLLSAFD